MKYSSLLSYILKPTSLLTQVFNNNKKSQERLFKNMCNCGEWTDWRNGRKAVSSYLGVEIINDQYSLVNPTPLDCITGYIMEDAIGDRDLKRMLQRRLNIIYSYI